MRAIVNAYSSDYKNAVIRLTESLAGRSNGIDFRTDLIQKSTHLLNPYHFKIDTIKSALYSGYRQILWLDSSCYAVNDVQPIFDIIESKGYFMEDSGHVAGRWTNDQTLQYFGISRDVAMEIPMYSAGFTGLNFDIPIYRQFYNEWESAMLAGMFKGGWHNRDKTESTDIRCEGHRHDMSCASIIAYKLGMKFEECNKYFQYAIPEDSLKRNSVIFKVQGI